MSPLTPMVRNHRNLLSVKILPKCGCRHWHIVSRVLPILGRFIARTLPAASVVLRPDSFPVFDRPLENAYVIADSNHGYKMIGVGALVAQELQGKKSALLEPFRLSRYADGKLHPVSNSPFPWS